jgi:hypothetical protein
MAAAGALLITGGASTAGMAMAATTPALDHGRGPGRGPHAGGEVTAINGMTITVTNPRGSQDILTTSSTAFTVNGAAGTLAGIAVGMYVHAEGTRATDGSFTATSVTASDEQPVPPAGGRGLHAGGEVTAINGMTITVTNPRGSQDILTTSSTSFTVNGAAGALSGVAVGMYVHAEGTRATDGSFTATSVTASDEQPVPPAGGMGRGRGGMGRGRGPGSVPPTITPEADT